MSQTVDEAVDLSMNAEQVYWADHVRERPELPPDLGLRLLVTELAASSTQAEQGLGPYRP
jgi:hypothetical protein